MPNVGSPRENRRRLYSMICYSIILYASPVWAEELHKFKAKRELIALWNLQKQVSITVITAYRTVALHLSLLGRIFSIEMQADILQQLYLEKRKALERGNVDEEALHALHRRLLIEAVIFGKQNLGNPLYWEKSERRSVTPTTRLDEQSLWRANIQNDADYFGAMDALRYSCTELEKLIHLHASSVTIV